MSFTRSQPVSHHVYDPDLTPNKAIQHVHAVDSAQWPLQAKQRFDTTYRTEYINRIRHPNEVAKPIRPQRNPLNSFLVLPPIPPKNNDYNDGQRPAFNMDQEVPGSDMMYRGAAPPSNYYGQSQQGAMYNNDSYLPEEPVLLTDFEEQRLSEQIRAQLGSPTIIDRLKLFYEELAKCDPNVTGCLHYSNIQMVAAQLGLHFEEDTLRFAMCKFVTPAHGRGFVHYEDMVRYFGKCLSAIHPNQFGMQQGPSIPMNGYDNGFYNNPPPAQYPYQYAQQGGTQLDSGGGSFDPDERQIQALLKQNLKNMEFSGTVDLDRLHHELRVADRNQSGLLKRQQVEEVVYKARIPIQRSLTFQILEKHCRADGQLYRWDAFVQYIRQQVLDMQGGQGRVSPVYPQSNPPRMQWLEQIRREYKDKERLQIIEDYNVKHNVQRLDSNDPTAWFARFLRLANVMYKHRSSTNPNHDFVLPREEARRLFRANNQVFDLKIDEDKLQRVLDACARNANVGIDDALKLFAK